MMNSNRRVLLNALAPLAESIPNRTIELTERKTVVDSIITREPYREYEPKPNRVRITKADKKAVKKARTRALLAAQKGE